MLTAVRVFDVINCQQETGVGTLMGFCRRKGRGLKRSDGLDDEQGHVAMWWRFHSVLEKSTSLQKNHVV